MPRTNSLAFRLVAIAAGWSVLGLIAGGFLLSSLFRSSIERSLDNRLVADLESVIAVAELDCGGTFTMSKPLIAERFNRAFSGTYWQAASMEQDANKKPKQLMRSRSLWNKVLPFSAKQTPGETQKGYAPGPIQQRLRLVERIVSLSGSDSPAPGAKCSGNKPFRIAIAADMKDIESEVESFNSTLFWSVVALGLSLVAAMALFVRLGLAPLDHVSKSLAAIREGRADRLEGKFPTEIQPLADELNALVIHNAEVVARARTHVGNLAHFLKTPLSVLANEVHGVPGPMAETVARQVQVMRRQVDHYLARARTVASASVLGARTDVAPVISDLSRALGKIYSGQGIMIERSCPEGLIFRGDRSDLEEMIGNLLDNACKWAEGQVDIAAALAPVSRLVITVSDDGPGLSEEQKMRVLERGERLDESKPGSGLGLGIVKEIALLYGGHLSLGQSATGGVSAILNLPAIDRGGIF
ncbi:MAG: sensor histidine kinase [Alphaproteobacteria bacterium]|nr:sensor histidine kinase [Alphaproteobacteria bacterium]